MGLLSRSEGPVSAGHLAAHFCVSRQIIVGDVALLRAAGADIAATPRGYILSRPEEALFSCKVACVHTPEEMGAELRTIVDAGGEAADVIVEHPVYGQLTGALNIRCRDDVEAFLRQVHSHAAQPLSALTGGVHLHTVRCRDEAGMKRVLAALEREGFLYR